MPQAKARYGGSRVVWDGQSFNSYPAPPESTPELVMSGLGVPWVKVSIDGEGWTQLTTTVTTRLFPHVRSTGPDILVMNGGQGDIASYGTGSFAADYWTRVTTYANNARAAGFDYIIYPTLAAMGPNILNFGIPTADGEAARVATNAQALAENTGIFDAVPDVAALLTDATNGTYYLGDRLHLRPAGGALAVSVIRPALQAILASL